MCSNETKTEKAGEKMVCKSSLGAAPNTPIQERILTMHEFLFFMIGFLLGGVIGISIMCLMQINRISRTPNIRKEDEEL